MLKHERVIIVLAGPEYDTCGEQTFNLKDKKTKKQSELKLFNLEVVIEYLDSLYSALALVGNSYLASLYSSLSMC